MLDETRSYISDFATVPRASTVPRIGPADEVEIPRLRQPLDTALLGTILVLEKAGVRLPAPREQKGKDYAAHQNSD